MKKILILSLLFLAVYKLEARKLILTKIGGNGQLTLPAGMPANGTPAPVSTLKYEEGVNGFLTSSSTNWTKYFSYFSDCINNDPQNDMSDVQYKIEIEAPLSTNPMIIGEQFTDANALWQSTKNISLDGTLSIPGQANSTATPINRVIIKGINGTANAHAYVKYANGLRYGSYIKPNSSLQYYIVTKISNNAVYYSTIGNTSTWPASSFIISGPFTHTNSTAGYHTLNNVSPSVSGGVWKNAYPNYAYIYNFLYNKLANNVSSDNIIIDGNSKNFLQWTMYGDVGRQIMHSGFAFYNSTNISINNCAASNMGLDGVMIVGSSSNININKSVFESNGRQGLSWVGGDNLNVANCQFNNTGKGLVASAPGAGMDIEPESGFTCTNGTFTNCEYKNNSGPGVVADNSSLSTTHTFTNCTFVGTTSWSTWAKHKDMNFIKSKFYGAAVHLVGSTIANDATYFESCTFSDCYKDENGLNVPVYFGNVSYKPLIEGTGNYENVTFYKCLFNAFNGAAMYLDNTNTNKFNIDQCTFNVAWCYSDNIIIRRANFTNNTYNRCAGTCICSFGGCGCSNTNNTLTNNTFNFWGQNGFPNAPVCCSTRVYNAAVDNSTIVPTMLLDIKVDFCAKGDGVTDDNGAFVAATNFINARGGKCELRIPYGVYRVGRQLVNYTASNSNPYAINSMPVLELQSCTDVKVIGVANPNGDLPQLKFNDGLYFGTFDPVTLQSTNSVAPFYDASTLANLKACVSVLNCTNTEIKNLIMDGNFYPGKVNVGGQYGWSGYQINHHGINIINSSNTTISDVDVHHFGVDGISINNKPGFDNVTITNSKFNYNTRTGLAHRGGNGITASNCEFNYTGYGLLSSSYMSGVEIVPISGSPNVCLNSNFTNCQMKFNKGIGLNLSNTSTNTYSHTFTSCLMVGTNSWSAWVKQRDVNFMSCKFYGAVVHSFPSSVYGDATSFTGCQFSDCYFDNGTQVSTYYGNSFYKPLVEGEENLQNVNFTNCNFNSYNGASIWMKNTLAGSFLFVNGCTFNNTWNNVDNVILSRASVAANTFNSFGNFNCALSTSCNGSNVLSGNTFNTWGVNGNPPAPTCNVANYKPSSESIALDDNGIEIYPNPNNGTFAVQLHNIKQAITMSVLDLSAKVVYQVSLTQDEVLNTQQLSLGYLRKGIYLLTISGNGVNERRKFIVQ